MAIDPNFFRGRLTPEQAKERLAWGEQQPEYKAAYFDKSHPLHSAYVEQTLFLREIALGVPGPKGATPAPLPTGRNPREIIREVESSTEYADRLHPGHASAVARVTEAYKALFPGEPPPIDVERKP